MGSGEKTIFSFKKMKESVIEMRTINCGTKFTSRSPRTGVSFQLNRNQKNVC
jgi:hypothetical protein